MGNVRLYGATSGYTELAPPAVAPDGVLSLPSGTGTIAKTTDQGLVHINTTTFSAVSSVSLNNVFTGDYDNYCLIVSGSSTATGTFRLRFRAAGTDATGANYRSAYTGLGSNGATVTANTDPDETSALITTINTDLSLKINLNLFNPQKTLTTKAFGHSDRSTTGSYYPQFGGFAHTLSTAYDGLTIYPSTGNSTGIIRVYGYKNS